MDATFIVLMAVCGVALKPFVGPMARLAGSALFMPSGSIAGAVYMMWPLLGLLVVRRFGTAASVGLLEAVIVMITGFYGSHGIITLITYVFPCMVMDFLFYMIPKKANPFWLALPAGLGNAAGSALVGFLVMRLPAVPLIISTAAAVFFGAFGGALAFGLYRLLIKTFPQFKKEN